MSESVQSTPVETQKAAAKPEVNSVKQDVNSVKTAVPPIINKIADKVAKSAQKVEEKAPTLPAKETEVKTDTKPQADSVKQDVNSVKPEVKVETEPAKPEANSVKQDVKPEDSTPVSLEEFKKREAEYVKKELSRKEEIKALQEEKKQAQARLQKLERLEAEAKRNPLKVLEEFGLTYDELTEAVLTQQNNMSDKDKEIAALRKEMEERFSAQERQKQEQERLLLEKQKEEVVSSFMKDISAHLQEKKEAYPHMLALYDRIGQAESPESIVYATIEAHFNSTGEILEYDVVAEKAEEWFKEQWQDLNSRFNNNKGNTPPEPTPVETKQDTKEEDKEEDKKEALPTLKKPLSHKAFKEVILNPEMLPGKDPTIPNNHAEKAKKDRTAITKALQAIDTFERARK